MLDSKDFECNSKNKMFKMKIWNEIMWKNHKHNNLYMQECITVCGEVNFTKTQAKMFHILHFSLWHINNKNIYMKFFDVEHHYSKNSFLYVYLTLYEDSGLLSNKRESHSKMKHNFGRWEILNMMFFVFYRSYQ